MDRASISLLTICGLEELEDHGTRGVTHVLSILDPGWPDPDAFGRYDRHHRTTLRFHDAIEAAPAVVLPQREDVEAILAFGDDLATDASRRDPGHLLVHCHMGISRSTAAMGLLLAQADPGADEEAISQKLLEIRPHAWPNSRMIAFGDEVLGRGGRLLAAVQRIHGRQLAAKPKLAEVMRGLNRGREVEEARPA